MIIEIREIYKCGHCRKVYQKKGFCESHEKSCLKNPNNYRPCFGCNHLSKRKYLHYYDNPMGESKTTLKLLYCNKFNNFTYPPKVEYKKNVIDTDPENKPMPLICNSFSNDFL